MPLKPFPGEGFYGIIFTECEVSYDVYISDRLDEHFTFRSFKDETGDATMIPIGRWNPTEDLGDKLTKIVIKAKPLPDDIHLTAQEKEVKAVSELRPFVSSYSMLLLVTNLQYPGFVLRSCNLPL